MKTITVRIPSARPRNPLATAARKRHAGAHGPCGRAQRRQANQSLQRELNALAERST